MSQQHFDIHQHITNQIVAAIEQGPGQFRLPWHRGGSTMCPVNIATNRAYRGVNIVALWAASEVRGFTTGIWGTYRQWAEAGGHVRKGETASHIVFYKEFEVAAEDGDRSSDTGTRLFARATPVFSAEQVDGYELPVSPHAVIDPIVAADDLLKASQARIQYGGSRAFYRPTADTVHIPEPSTFIGSATSTPQEAFYATVLHELTHWTTAEHRCNRELGKRFGDQAYAMEELVAELGAAFLCGQLGITPEPRLDHAQYLATWLNVLKADKRAIFTAASAASKACDYLANLRPG